MILKIHPENPSERQMKIVNECLNDGGVIIYPTDSVYALGCDIFKTKAIDRVARIKGTKKERADFSFVCYDLSQLSDFTKSFGNSIYKMMRANLPGPFTFILKANSNVPKIFQSKKKTLGIRVPDNNIPREIVNMLGNPIISTSIHHDDEILDYITDPELIHERFHKLVDIVIDGGFGDNQPSTIVDCTEEEPMVIRQGKGELS